MADEREIIWGDSNWRTSIDANDSGRAIVAETPDGTVLLEYDESANAGSGGWIYRGPVEMNGNDVTGVGTLDATSVSTGVLSLANHPNITNIEFGTVTVDGVDNSTGNDSWGQSAGTSSSVTFDTEFASTPRVVLTQANDLDSVDTDRYKVSVAGTITTTGFDAYFQQMSADDRSGTTDAYAAYWVAFA